MVQLNSNLEGYSTLEAFTLLPPGEYHVGIMNSELKNTRAGGSMLCFTYEVMEGDYQGRKVWDNLNLWHTNPKTVEIAMRQLKSIATASGYPNPNYIPDSSELHGREMNIRLAVRKDDSGNEFQDIKAYMAPKPGVLSADKASGLTSPTAPAAFTQTSLPPRTDASSRKPWE